MAIEEEADVGVPEWVVTFGDMMSLLLTFFIMLVSMSEIKEEERFQAMVDSMRKRFGYDAAMVSFVPGNMKPRNSAMEHLATLGRARRQSTMEGGDKVKAPVGDNPRVQAIRSGQLAVTGGIVYFDWDQYELSEEHKQVLQGVAEIIGGKAQKVEIRGHAVRRPRAGDPDHDNPWDLAYARCRSVMAFLTEMGINRRRFRLGVAGATEPVYLGVDPVESRKNSRVEIVLMDQRTEDLEGTDEQREQRYRNR